MSDLSLRTLDSSNPSAFIDFHSKVCVIVCFLCVCVCGTVVLVFDGEAEDVAGPEAGAIVHTAVEQRVGVGVLDVQDLARGRHVTRDALISGDTKLFLHRHTHAKISTLVFTPSASNWLVSDRK